VLCRFEISGNQVGAFDDCLQFVPRLRRQAEADVDGGEKS
jgi:hypothetical protein